MSESENLEKIFFPLVKDILNAKPEENEWIKNFDSLVKNDFSSFCDSVKGLNQVKAVITFERIRDEMKLIANCPPIHSKMVGAIGGGFSSGKSSFINSFMQEGTVRLATGIVPVTAIPSYVITGGNPSITGISFRGGSFAIKDEMYAAISHKLLKSLDFDLKQILRYITVETCLDEKLFSNICLIDTPGYNAPGTGTTGQDRETAFSYIEDAKFLVWLVGLDSKGTINTDDLEFLDNLPFGKEAEKSLYVVANKADVVKPGDHEAILETFKDVLDDYNVQYEGISLYDSKKKKEYLFDGKSIGEFFLSQNEATKKYVELALPLKAIFDRYEKYVLEKHKIDTAYQKKVKALWLDGFEGNAISLTSVSSKLEEGLNELTKYFKPDDLDPTLKKIDELRGKFFTCLDSFCAEMGIEKAELPKDEAQDGEKNEEPKIRRKKFCDKCGTRLAEKNNFCPKCGTSTKL
ncbi:MAG: dynamin family protein [Treponema sp.]|nr:dynamin family protein [Treponema sp.]